MADRNPLIFISYRGSDENWATALVHLSLKKAFGEDAVFKAGNSIPVGEDFQVALRKEAASCPVMLACIGPGWLTATGPDGSRRLDSPDDWVREEIRISLESRNRLVPLLLGNRNEVQVPEPDQVPESIRAMVYRQALWVDPGRGLEATIVDLIDQLTKLTPKLAECRARIATQPAGDAVDTPWGAFAERTGSARASSSGNANTGVQGWSGAGEVRAEGTGDAVADGQGSRANTGVQREGSS